MPQNADRSARNRSFNMLSTYRKLPILIMLSIRIYERTLTQLIKDISLEAW